MGYGPIVRSLPGANIQSGRMSGGHVSIARHRLEASMKPDNPVELEPRLPPRPFSEDDLDQIADAIPIVDENQRALLKERLRKFQELHRFSVELLDSARSPQKDSKRFAQ